MLLLMKLLLSWLKQCISRWYILQYLDMKTRTIIHDANHNCRGWSGSTLQIHYSHPMQCGVCGTTHPTEGQGSHGTVRPTSPEWCHSSGSWPGPFHLHYLASKTTFTPCPHTQSATERLCNNIINMHTLLILCQLVSIFFWCEINQDHLLPHTHNSGGETHMTESTMAEPDSLESVSLSWSSSSSIQFSPFCHMARLPPRLMTSPSPALFFFSVSLFSLFCLYSSPRFFLFLWLCLFSLRPSISLSP